QLQLRLVRAMPRDRVGHLWVLHAKSVPRNGLRERRDLERDADEPRSLLPRRAIDPFQQDESVGRMRPVFFHMRGVPTDFNEVALFYSHPHPSCSCPAQLEEIARSGAIWECPIRTRWRKCSPVDLEPSSSIRGRKRDTIGNHPAFIGNLPMKFASIVALTSRTRRVHRT